MRVEIGLAGRDSIAVHEMAESAALVARSLAKSSGPASLLAVFSIGVVVGMLVVLYCDERYG